MWQVYFIKSFLFSDYKAKYGVTKNEDELLDLKYEEEQAVYAIAIKLNQSLMNCHFLEVFLSINIIFNC